MANQFCIQIAYKSLGGGDAHATTLSIFNLLSNYSWDAKLVLTLAAFAANYGEFWLLAQIYTTNQLAKSMAILKQLPVILEHSGPLKPRFEALNNLIKAMMDVTRCIIEFKELPPMYISQDVPALATAMTHIPTAVYWTIRSVVACATQITSLTSMGHEYVILSIIADRKLNYTTCHLIHWESCLGSNHFTYDKCNDCRYWMSATSEAWELSTLTHKINSILDLLKKQLDLCYQYIGRTPTIPYITVKCILILTRD